jgi:hypothetical protein
MYKLVSFHLRCLSRDKEEEWKVKTIWNLLLLQQGLGCHEFEEHDL